MSSSEEKWGIGYRRRREARGFSSELCAGLAGISLRTLDRYEKGYGEPQISDGRRLEFALENPVAALIQLVGDWAAEAADRPSTFLDLEPAERDLEEVRELLRQQAILVERSLGELQSRVPTRRAQEQR